MNEKELEPQKFYAAANEMPSASSNATSIRAMKEIEGQIVMAKKFPRDEEMAISRILKSCKRYPLAKASQYAYPRGGQTISGPSIRMAEVIAQNWGNLDFGIRELSQENGHSLVESYCWDLETNVRQAKIFQVPHERKAKGKIEKLTDPRDVYEHIANYGARRLRACILGIIPSDVIEMATNECDKTLEGKNDTPLIDRVRAMLEGFSKLGVTQEMIEDRLKHKVQEMDTKEVVEYGKIFNSLRDGISKREEWFKFTKEEAPETAELNAGLKNLNQNVDPGKVEMPSQASINEEIPKQEVLPKAKEKAPPKEKPTFTL